MQVCLFPSLYGLDVGSQQKQKKINTFTIDYEATHTWKYDDNWMNIEKDEEQNGYFCTIECRYKGTKKKWIKMT